MTKFGIKWKNLIIIDHFAQREIYSEHEWNNHELECPPNAIFNNYPGRSKLLLQKSKLHFHKANAAETMTERIEGIVRQRLDELTPERVKEIVEDMIRQHLDWLVVWGGVFGGLIGLLTHFFI